MKKLILFVVLSFFTGFAVAESEEENLNQFISTVDNIDTTKGYILLGDAPYKMVLNMKVFDKNNKPINRYALKLGQSVEVVIDSYRKRVPNVQSIKILQ